MIIGLLIINLKNIMNDFNREKFRENMHKVVDQAVDKLGGNYDQISDKAAEFYGKASEKASHAKEMTQKYVRENPQKSLIMAAGVGAISAMIVVGVMRRRKC
jgi:ElaB/YqjD/DUF883 family membrane-anchored ribosome-binding protein